MPRVKVSARPEDVGLSSAGMEELDAYLRSEVDAGTIPGAVIVVARKGRVCHAAAIGFHTIATDRPLCLDDGFRIFSMTKPVTAAGLMMLWDEGRWQFDDPVALHLPELGGLQVYDGHNADGSIRVVNAEHQPTMRELVTHTAGFGYALAMPDPKDPIDEVYRHAGVWDADDLPDMMQRIARCPLAYQPGTSWRYSIGMDIQGAIIERLTGTSLSDFLSDRLFAPLGMDDTHFHIAPNQKDKLATLYLRFGNANLTPIHNLLQPDYEAPHARPLGGSGLFSTAGDYTRFAQFLLDGGSHSGVELLSREAIHQIMSDQMPDALRANSFTAGHQSIGPGFAMGVNGVVFTDPALAGAPVGRGTYQWDGAAGTWFWIDPENDLLCVGMTQVLSPDGPNLQRNTQQIIYRSISA